MLRGIFTGVAAFLESVAIFLRLKERRMNEEVGGLKQREADQRETLKAKDDQLEKAVNRKPGDARKRLRDGSF